MLYNNNTMTNTLISDIKSEQKTNQKAHILNNILEYVNEEQIYVDFTAVQNKSED